MSTPFPPNSKRKGPSIYAPPHARDRALPQDLPQDSAEIADPSAQTEIAPAAGEPPGPDQTPAPAAAESSRGAGDANDPLDWLDDAIRAVVELKHATDRDEAADPSVSAPYSPSITPVRDETDERTPSHTRQPERTESQTGRPRPSRLSTQIVPPPPAPARQSSQLGQIMRLTLAIVFAAVAAYGVTLFYSSRPSAPSSKDSDASIAQPASQSEQAEISAPPQTPSRLVVEDRQAFANEPLPLAVDVEHAAGSETVLLDGLAQGTTLSAGMSMRPSSWQLPPDKLAGLYLYAPKDFVGVMNTTVKLLGPDNRLLDSRDMRLKWISKPAPKAPEPIVASAGNQAPVGVHIGAVPSDAPAIRPIDPGEAAMLMARGRDFLASGDISAARVAFRRLADAGMPDAALALANTYDPAYLASHNVIGALGDSAMARRLYQRARELGSAEAGQILARMGDK